jgi:hypothetical protein
MPYPLPREPRQQDVYNLELQESFAATRRVPPPQPSPGAPASASTRDPIEALKELGQLHSSGVLSDDEFATAKAKILQSDEPVS